MKLRFAKIVGSSLGLCACAGAFLPFTDFVVGSARADNPNLNASVKGTYPFNETIIAGVATPVAGVCPAATPGQPYPNVYQQLSLTNQGTWSFDGKGNVKMDDTGVEVLVPGAGTHPVDVMYSEAHCKGTYQVNANSTIDFHYYCSVPQPGNFWVTFDVTAKGIITPHTILVAVPPAPNATARVTPVYFGSNEYSINGASLVGCSVVGENTTISLTSDQNEQDR